MEIIVGLEVVLYAVEVNQDIVELLQKEEATGHALTAWDSIAFCCGCSYELEELLGCFEVLL